MESVQPEGPPWAVGMRPRDLVDLRTKLNQIMKSNITLVQRLYDEARIYWITVAEVHARFNRRARTSRRLGALLEQLSEKDILDLDAYLMSNIPEEEKDSKKYKKKTEKRPNRKKLPKNNTISTTSETTEAAHSSKGTLRGETNTSAEEEAMAANRQPRNLKRAWQVDEDDDLVGKTHSKRARTVTSPTDNGAASSHWKEGITSNRTFVLPLREQCHLDTEMLE